MKISVTVSIFSNQLSSIYSSGFHTIHQNDYSSKWAFQKYTFQYLTSRVTEAKSLYRTLEFVSLNIPLGDYDTQPSSEVT